MKSLIIIAVLTFAAFSQTKLIDPNYLSSPAVTFYDNGTLPVIRGTPTVGKEVGLNVSGYNIVGYRFSGDSLVLSAEPTPVNPIPIPGPITELVVKPIVFANDTSVSPTIATVLNVYLKTYNGLIMKPLAIVRPIDDSIITLLGQVRIFPDIKTTPVFPIAGDSTELQLVMGYTSAHPSCGPYYGVSYKVENDSIFLTYTEIVRDMVCLMMAIIPPRPYGPSFTIDKLKAGTYTLIMEDSVNVGTMQVSNPLMVTGSVTVMKDPRTKEMTRPVPKAVVTAVELNPCSWYIDRGIVYDTLFDTTDALGSFKLMLPYNGSDFLVTVTKEGYYPQSVCTKSYPVMEGDYSGQEYIKEQLSFELLDTAKTASDSLTVLVTMKGVPVESAYVNLSEGRALFYCIMVDMAYSASEAMSMAGSLTGKDGRFVIKDLSLNPFIDYYYDIYNVNIIEGRKSGIFRMNAYVDNLLHIELGAAAVEAKPASSITGNLSIQPNPFNSETRIVLGSSVKRADLRIYDVSGRMVQSFMNVKAKNLVWNAKGMPSGIYLLKAKLDSKIYTKKLFVQR